MALFSLVPYILVASGAALYRTQIVRTIGTSDNAVSVIEGLSIAAYAFGALFGGDLVNRVAQRHLFLTGQCLFVVGWLLVAIAGGTITYGAGRVLSGFATGTLLVTSLPPIVQQFPPERVPLTAAFINLGLFGAVAAGPLLGGLVAGGHAWRPLYGGFAALGLLNMAIAWWTLPLTEPNNPDLPFDRLGVALAFAGTVLPFWASGELRSYGFGSPIVAVPLGIGLVCFLALMLVEYHKREALAPVAKMWVTFPVTGTLVAMVGGGTFVTFVLLTVQFLLKIGGLTPLDAGLSFWSQAIGAMLAAAALGIIFPTRFLPVLALFGMLVLIAGGSLLALLSPDSSEALLLTALGLLGLGAGATVSPGLLMAGLTLPVRIIGRILALIELVRSVADFILAPVMLHVAKKSSGGHLTVSGIHMALWMTVAIAAAGTLFAVALFALSGERLQRPDLKGWIREGRPAIRPTPLLDALLRRS